MLFYGFDPGLNGGVCALDEDDNVVLLEPMPVVAGLVDGCALASVLMEDLARRKSTEGFHACAIVENVHAMPKQGVSSTFKFGHGFGVIEGVLAALGIPEQFVRPQAWQKVVLGGTPAAASPKARALLAAQRLYPNVDLVRGTVACWRDKARKPHDGLVDALLIARYGWLQRGR